MASVDEGGVHASADLKDLVVDRSLSEIIEAVQCVEGRIERFVIVVASTVVPAASRTKANVFLLQVGRIQHDQSCQLARG